MSLSLICVISKWFFMNFCASIIKIKPLLLIDHSTHFLQLVCDIVVLQVRFVLIESRFVTSYVVILPW